MDKDRINAINSYLLGVKAGDKLSLELLYKEISPTIRYIAFKYLQNESEANDIIQDFWADIYRIADGFISIQNSFSYLCKVMTRMAINRFKLVTRDKRNVVHYVDYEKFAQTTDIEQAEVSIYVESAMKKLTDTEKIIIQLTYFEQMTIREIAKVLKISKSMVGKLKLRAISTMKSDLCQYFVDKTDV